MSCYFLYTMTPVVEVALVPTGYVLGHALSSVQQSASSSRELILRPEKYLHHQVPELGSSSMDIPQVHDLEKPILDSSTRPSTRLFRRRGRRGSRSHGVNVDSSRRQVRRQRLRPRVSPTFAESGLSPGDVADRERLTTDPTSSLESRVPAGRPLLYCNLCRVKLNAALQAKQHFEGKTHAKKVKLAQMCSTKTSKTVTIPHAKTSTAEDAVTSSSSSSSSSPPSSFSSGIELLGAATASTPPSITSPDIYCSVCGISFNSDKQSKQHYRGKLHAKKQRLANHLSRCATRRRLRLAMVQDEGRQRMGRVDAKENHTPETRHWELSDSKTATR